METDLAAAYARCRELHRKHGRTYYLATRLLPAWKRRHVHALYGFTRFADEIVDQTESLPPAQRAALLTDWSDRFVAGLRGAPVDDPLLPAVLHTIAVFDLDTDDFASFLRSMAMDLTVTSYATYDDLLDYMEGSAAVIGTMMLPILGSSDPAAAREPARQLGFAFQLTNFIRDVGEDLDRGRTYLPDEHLAAFGVTRDDLTAAHARGACTPAIKDLIRFEVARAGEHYAAAAPGIPLLTPGSQACMRTAYHLYGGILDEIAAADFDVFAGRALVPNRRRAAVALRSLLTRGGGPPPVPGPPRERLGGGGLMRVAVVLFTRDLRVHDHPALATACATAERVVPLFVLDPQLLKLSPNRSRFLHQALADLRATLRDRGGDLIVRHGDPVAETIAVARAVEAEGVAVTADISGYATRRETRLREACEQHRIALRTFPGTTVVEPGAVRPGGGGGHYRVFSPYHRAWDASSWRAEAPTPKRVPLPDGVDPGELPDPPAGESPNAATGGETEALRLVKTWLKHVGPYDDLHDDMPADGTSRLSPYLRFGCVSPLSLATAIRRVEGAGPAAYLRQLAWRDFYYQVAYGFPTLSTEAIRSTGDGGWRYDADALQHWQDGLTGVPVVDAGMRQLREEGWMHNRARLITASFLTKHLNLDWRDGVRWYFRWLLDGDVANNSGNWQWVAGTGNDTKPYRRFNPIRQAQRFDPDGDYVRRYVPELRGIAGAEVHQPWRLPPVRRRTLDYPGPLESHRDEAVWLRP